MEYSIVIPARNEQALLQRCLDSVRNAVGSRSHEIIVVINRCTDGTEQIATANGCRIIKNDEKNLSRIRNAGGDAARGDVIVTVDADSFVSPRTFSFIEKAMQERCIGGAVPILPERYSAGIVLTLVCLIPVILMRGVSCGLFFTERETFKKLKGFNRDLVSAEDIDFALRLKKFGKLEKRNFKILWKAPIHTSCRKFDKFGDWYFLRHPAKCMKLLKGNNQALADEVWYDFPRS